MISGTASPMLNQTDVPKILDLYLPTVNVMPEWTEGDAKNLEAFFGTATGRKVAQVANFHVCQAALTAAAPKRKIASDAEVESGDYHRGMAHGIRVAYATIESMKFRTPQTQEGTQGDQSGLPSEFME